MRFGLWLQHRPLAELPLCDLLSIHGDVARRIDAYANLRPVDRNYRYLDFIADTQRFTGAARQNQHWVNLVQWQTTLAFGHYPLRLPMANPS